MIFLVLGLEIVWKKVVQLGTIKQVIGRSLSRCLLIKFVVYYPRILGPPLHRNR